MAQRSRVAALTGPDKEYVKLLERSIAEMKAQRAEPATTWACCWPSTNLQKSTTLVVLSACETGLGSVASGDELIGLTRAFMYAGAPQVVATLWRIGDESTAQLMDDFYEQLRTQPAANALRIAQLRLRARYPDPFYWAGFSIFGHFR